MFCSGLHFLRLFMHEANSCNRKFGQKHPVRPQTLATEKGATSKRIKNYEWTARIWRPHELTSKLESLTLGSQVMEGRDRWKPTKREERQLGVEGHYSSVDPKYKVEVEVIWRHSMEEIGLRRFSWGFVSEVENSKVLKFLRKYWHVWGWELKNI